jgi:exosortase
MTFEESLKSNKVYLLATVCLIVLAYHAVIPDMVRQWYSDENYSHAFFVPLIAGYFLYTRRESLKAATVSPWGPGLIIIILSLIQLVLGKLAVEYFTMRSSLIVLLAGAVLFLFGREVFRLTLLPLAYLLLMVPLPYIIYDAVAFPLKLFVTWAAVHVLKVIGIVVLREGNIIMFPSITLEVADACSGMRSLVSLVALAAAYAFYIDTTTGRRWAIIASAVPIAIFTNASRVIITGVLAQRWGAAVAGGFFHEFAGLFVFAVALTVLLGIGALVKRGNAGD